MTFLHPKNLNGIRHRQTFLQNISNSDFQWEEVGLYTQDYDKEGDRLNLNLTLKKWYENENTNNITQNKLLHRVR